MPENTIERQVLDRLIRIETMVEGINKSKEQTYENQRAIIITNGTVDQVQKDVAAIKERDKWLSRTVVGAALTSLVAAVMAVLMAVG